MTQRANKSTGRAVRRDAYTGMYVPLPPSPADGTYSDPELGRKVQELVARISAYKAKLRDAS